MSTVKIITDSTNDLSSSLLEGNEVDVVPLYAVLEDHSYRDGIDITCGELLDWCDAHGATPKTSAVSVADFVKAFGKYVEAGRDVVYIGLSSEISSTVQNALLAAREFPPGRVEVVNSMSLSSGIGYLVLEAAALSRQGKSAAEIRTEIEAMVPRMNVSFLIDTLTYLHRGGRCTALQMLGANMLSLKPEIVVRDGKMTTNRKYRGSIGKALNRYLKDHMAERESVDPRRILITHSPTDPEVVAEIRRQVEALGYFREVYDTDAGCVITSHCGPNTLGVIYMDR